MIKLGVNIDHVATLRQARGTNYPDPVYAAQIAEAAGAHGERLSDPADVAAAVARCLAALDAGQSALLHVRITPL